MNLKYIVTGTGRCATVYFAKMLTNLGIECGHETIFSYDGFENAKARLRGNKRCELSRISKDATRQNERNWFPSGIKNIQADSSYMAAPFIDDKLFEDVGIIHLVRSPMEVINSFLVGFGYFRDSCMHNGGERCYHQFIYKHTPDILNYSDPVDRAAAYYILWNTMIEEKSKNRRYFRFNINNKNFNKLFNFLEIEKFDNLLQRKLNERHTSKKYSMTSQIPSLQLREQIVKLQSKYCYIKM